MDSKGRFLMVNEPAGIAGGKPNYWLPAGRVDANETMSQAGEREALEEAGVHVEVCGVLRFMLSKGTPRVLLLAHPCSAQDGGLAKSIPDFESVGAMWVWPDQLEQLSVDDYRSPDPARYFPAVAHGNIEVHSVDTQEFAAFEKQIQKLTAGQGSIQKLEQCWKDLKKRYPSQAFREQ